MRSRSLKHKIRFQQFTEVKGDFGGVTEQWADILNAEEWVQIIPLKGEERYVSARKETTVDHKIRLRYRSDIDMKMRIVYGTRVFEIDSIIDPYERNRELHLMATEVFNG